MQTFTIETMPFQLPSTKKTFERRMFSLSGLLFCSLLINNVFIATTQAQCPYNISLVSKTYNAAANRTTFVWKVFNPNPGNGDNGTGQDLSHWRFTINTCTNPADASHQGDIICAV